MEKDTMRFIKALKQGAVGERPIREIAIDWFCEWSCCTRETYTEARLYDVVLMRFLDYLDTADRPSAVIKELLDARRIRCGLEIPERSAIMIEDMLITLMLTQVKDYKGYINGFTEYIED